MNLRHVCLVFALGIFLPAQAQLVKSFHLITPSQQSTLVLSGNKSDAMPFVWTGGKAAAPAGTNFDYSIFFDLPSGDFSMPLDNITKNCCASYFNDTLFTYQEGDWADFLNPISQQLRGRDFLIGDTLDLKWRVLITAVAPGPIYENEESSQDFQIRFIRGQFTDEYVPVSLNYPAHNGIAAIGGDPNQTLTFSWSAAYCPAGCAPASFELLIDTVDGDFSNPYYSVTVPGNDSSYEIGYTTLNQMLQETKTPEQATRAIYWRVLAIGNNQVVYSRRTSRLVVLNLSLDNENHAYGLVNPTNNTVITLKGDANTQLNFKWESTFTPLHSTDKYYLAFDTVGASPLFSNPVFQFEVQGNGNDTAINLRYGTIDHALDSLYGKNWGKVKLMWAAIASINGTLYYPSASYSIEMRSGNITSLETVNASGIKVYPNPAIDRVYIATDEPGFSYTLYNACGMRVKEATVNGSRENVDMSGLEKGLYFIRVEQAGSVYNSRLVLTH